MHLGGGRAATEGLEGPAAVSLVAGLARCRRPLRATRFSRTHELWRQSPRDYGGMMSARYACLSCTFLPQT